jgi:hypothetical protein
MNTQSIAVPTTTSCPQLKRPLLRAYMPHLLDRCAALTGEQLALTLMSLGALRPHLKVAWMRVLMDALCVRLPELGRREVRLPQSRTTLDS